MDKIELTKLLHKNFHHIGKTIFPQNGFKRYKDKFYIRETDDDILQLIEIQKHSWDTKFTYNICIFPLFFKSENLYYAFGGIRIGMFKSGKDYWWDYSTESEINKSLVESLELINSKVINFFNSINNCDRLLKYLDTKDCLFESYKYRPKDYDNSIGLLYLKKGDKEMAHKFLNNETINEIKKFGEKTYFKNIVKQNIDILKMRR